MHWSNCWLNHHHHRGRRVKSIDPACSHQSISKDNTNNHIIFSDNPFLEPNSGLELTRVTGVGNFTDNVTNVNSRVISVDNIFCVTLSSTGSINSPSSRAFSSTSTFTSTTPSTTTTTLSSSSPSSLRHRSRSFLDGLSASMDRCERFGLEPPSPPSIYRHLYDRERAASGFDSINGTIKVDQEGAEKGRKSRSMDKNDFAHNLDNNNAHHSSTDHETSRNSTDKIINGKSGAYEQAQLLLVSLLENFCALYDRNPDKNRRLFMALCKQLWNMGILTSADFFNRSEKLRGVYKEAFRTLVLQAIDGIEGADISIADGDQVHVKLLTSEGDNGLPSRDHAASPTQTISSRSFGDSGEEWIDQNGDIGNGGGNDFGEAFQAKPVISRLESEFRNLQLIGRGGFARVFSGEHRIDYCQYAFKRIEFESKSSDSYEKIIREIKSLAHLDHPFIVRYHGAWIEEKPRTMTLAAATRRRSRRFSGHSLDSSSASHNFVLPRERFSNDMYPGGIAVPLANGATEFEVWDGEGKDAGYFMIIQMELCQFTLADWIDQRNFLIKYGKNWRPEYGSRHSRSVANGRTNTIPSDRMAMLVGEGATWDINPAENCRIFKCIVKALQHIHTKGIIHRDLKPGNILFQVDDGHYTPKIGDFGLASDISPTPASTSGTSVAEATLSVSMEASEEWHRRSSWGTSAPPNNLSPCELYAQSPSQNTNNSRSKRTTGLGTSTYAAPEQIRDSEYDEKVDIYSLGIILFELFHPFGTRMERQDILEDLKKGIFPASFVKCWPKEATLIWSCISPNAEMRPSAQQILESEILEQDPEDTIERLVLENSTLKKLLEMERERVRYLQQNLDETNKKADLGDDEDDKRLLEELKAFRLP